MSTPPVYWHQGMFLRPHHFQAAERYFADQIRRSGKFDVHHNWGARIVQIDPAGLKNFRFEVERLAARMRDGTLVLVEKGTDHSLDPLDLKPAMEELGPGQTVDVLLAVPLLQLGRPNAGRPEDPSTRYHVDPAREPVEDENDGKTPCLVDHRRLNVRLFTSLQDTTGYDILPIVRLERSVKATGEPQIHEPYIPPVLACDGWAPLGVGVIGQVYNRVGGLVKQLSRTVKDQNIRFDSNNPDHRKMFERLRALNEGWAAFGVIANADGVHPFLGYLELCRLVGKLSVFGKSATLPDLPVYDHDDLGRCFFTVKRHLDDLLTEDFNLGYEVRPFVGEGLKMRVKIEPTWLAPACQVLVGVDSDLSATDCARLLSGKLNMKIGALERVDVIFKDGLRGVDFVHDHKPPSVLPAGPTYFRINRDSSKDEWWHVNQSYNLAIRLNQTLILGSLDGKQAVTIQADGKTATLGFTLYVVLPAAQS
jgi:type VI secretion system protein ImpJ